MLGSWQRTLLLVLTALLASATVIYVQSQFDQADERAALRIVTGYRSRTGRSIPETLEARHPGRPVSYTTRVESACFQHIRVRAIVDERPGTELVYELVVDINGPAIHPGGALGKELLAELDRPTASRADGDAAAPAHDEGDGAAPQDAPVGGPAAQQGLRDAWGGP